MRTALEQMVCTSTQAVTPTQMAAPCSHMSMQITPVPLTMNHETVESTRATFTPNLRASMETAAHCTLGTNTTKTVITRNERTARRDSARSLATAHGSTITIYASVYPMHVHVVGRATSVASCANLRAGTMFRTVLLHPASRIILMPTKKQDALLLEQDAAIARPVSMANVWVRLHFANLQETACCYQHGIDTCAVRTWRAAVKGITNVIATVCHVSTATENIR